MAAFKQYASLFWALSLLLVPVLVHAPEESGFTTEDIEQGDALALLSKIASNNTEVIARRKSRRDGPGCTPSQLSIRREW